MTSNRVSAVAVFAGLVTMLGWGATLAQQQSTVDVGKTEYLSNCGLCHGVTGKGDGVYNELLKKNAPDLTGLMKANNGVFPYQKIHDIIEGRQDVKAHGPRDMPIWGADFLARGVGDNHDASETHARTRITALIDYVQRLQAK